MKVINILLWIIIVFLIVCAIGSAILPTDGSFMNEHTELKRIVENIKKFERCVLAVLSFYLVVSKLGEYFDQHPPKHEYLSVVLCWASAAAVALLILEP